MQPALKHGLGAGRAALFGANGPPRTLELVAERVERTLRVLVSSFWGFRFCVPPWDRRSRGFFHVTCHDTEIAV